MPRPADARRYATSAAKPLVFLLALVPAACSFAACSPAISASILPRRSSSQTGRWAFKFLLLTLAVTPRAAADRLERRHSVPAHARPVRVLLRDAALHVVLGVRSVLRLRRAWSTDVAKRPFILLGFTAFLLMMPLAAHLDEGLDPPARARWATAAPAGLPVGDPAPRSTSRWKVKVAQRRPASWYAVYLLKSLLGFRRSGAVVAAGRSSTLLARLEGTASSTPKSANSLKLPDFRNDLRLFCVHAQAN